MKKPKQQKPLWLQIVLCGLGLILIFLFSAFTSPYWHGNVFQFFVALTKLKAGNLHFTFSGKTLKMTLVLVLILVIAVALYKCCNQRNYRHGEEHGSTKWEDPGFLSHKYGEKEKKNSPPPEKPYDLDTVQHPNLILTQNMKLSLNAQKTRRNLNVLVIGGAGAGKSMFYARPNILQANTGYIVLDPKGELTEDCGGFLKRQGYTVWVLDLKHPESSDRYNPFDFLETEDDVLQLVDNIFDNTTDKEARKGEQIWDDSAKSLLRALIFYVREMLPKEQQNFTSVMRYLRRAKTEEDEMGNPKPSQLDGDMLELQRKLEHDNKKADSHPAYRAYQEYRSGAAKTMQSVLFTLNARLSKFNVQSIADLTSQNELELKRMGREKIAIFAVIPDDNQSYNFLVGMLYTQLFQQLYRSADDYRGKKLPVPVHFLMDEFANVALPKSFESLLSTMRQRQIFCSIILQNLSQLKALYEKQWESIVGNCDSFLYLGGNEQSTFEYVSKRLGTETIDIDSYSQSKGRNGSSSKSTQLQKRELMLPDEVGRLDNKYAIYIMRGENPILDLKYDVFHHPNFSEIALGGAESYHYSEEKIAEREQRQRTWDLQEREAIQRKNTAELDAFFHDHAAEDGSIELNLDELDYSSEELMQYAASLMHTGKEKAQ